MRSRLAPALLGLVLACAAPELDYVPPPEVAGTSVVFASVRNGALSDSLSFEADAAWKLTSRVSPDTTLYALSYAATLEELGLVAGAAVDPARSRCRLWYPQAVRQLDARGATAWVESEAKVELLKLLVEDGQSRCTLCATHFAEHRLSFGSGTELDQLRVAAPLTSGHVFGVSYLGTRWALSREGGVELSGCGTDPIFGIFALSGDRYWLGGRGELQRVRVDEAAARCAVEERVQLPTPYGAPSDEVRWIAGDLEGEEVFTLSSTTSLDRYAEGRLTHVTDLAINPRFLVPQHTWNGGLHWLGPGRVVANASSAEIEWWKDGRLERRETVPVAARESVTELSRLRDGRIVVGTGIGRFFVFEEVGPAVPIGATNTADDIGTIVPLGGGFVATIREGLLADWFPETGVCRTELTVNTDYRGDFAFLDLAGDLVIPDAVRADSEKGRISQVVWITLEK